MKILEKSRYLCREGKPSSQSEPPEWCVECDRGRSHSLFFHRSRVTARPWLSYPQLDVNRWHGCWPWKLSGVMWTSHGPGWQQKWALHTLTFLLAATCMSVHPPSISHAAMTVSEVGVWMDGEVPTSCTRHLDPVMWEGSKIPSFTGHGIVVPLVTAFPDYYSVFPSDFLPYEYSTVIFHALTPLVHFLIFYDPLLGMVSPDSPSIPEQNYLEMVKPHTTHIHASS